jgi:hypothetical protein
VEWSSRLTTQANLDIDTPITTETCLIRIADIAPSGLVGPDPRPFLVDHIRQYGVLSPIIVRPIPLTDDPFGPIYAIVDGRRRVMAVLTNNEGAHIDKVFIPAIIVSDQTHPAALTLAMHASRSTNLVVEAEMIDDLSRLGMTDKEIARLSGMHLGRVRKVTRYLRLIPEMRLRMRNNEIPIYALDAMVTMSEEQQGDIMALLDGVDPMDGSTDDMEPFSWREAIEWVRKVQVAGAFAALDMFGDEPPAPDPLASIRQAVSGLSPAHRRELAAWLAATL